MSRLWFIAAATLGAIAVIRRRYARQASPKLDVVSTDWLADARSRPDDTL